MYYVYALIDIRTGDPFYIGKGLKANTRHLDHFKERADTTSNRYKTFKILYLTNNGFDVPVKILVDNIESEHDAYLLEAKFIKQYGRENIDENGILTNICIDNQPPSHLGKKQSKLHIEKRVASYVTTCNTVGRKKHSEQTKAKIGRNGKENAFYGKHHTSEVKEAHSIRMSGNKNNSKEFVFVNPAGEMFNVVGEFAKFCLANNLVVSTMEKVLKYNKIPTSGKCKGWLVIRKIK